MIAINKIVVPTDLSDLSLPAIGYALALAKQHSAELRVVHVLPTDTIKEQFSHGYAEGLAPPAGDPAITARRPHSMGDVFESKKQLLRTFLEQRFGGGLLKGMMVKPDIRFGKVVEEIIAAAKEEKCDLLVMATEPTRLSSLFRARLTERVARQAPCPILIIQPSAEITTDKNERVPVTLVGKWAA